MNGVDCEVASSSFFFFLKNKSDIDVIRNTFGFEFWAAPFTVTEKYVKIQVMSKVSTYMVQYSLTYNHILYNHLPHLPLPMKTCRCPHANSLPCPASPLKSDLSMYDGPGSQNYPCPRPTLVTKMMVMCLSTLSLHPLLFVIILGWLFFIIIILINDEMTNNWRAG